MKNKDKRATYRGLFKGEWILLIAVLLISGVTSFFFTRAQLERTGHSVQVENTSAPGSDISR